MNRFTVYSLLLTAFLLSGCVSRVVPHDVDRVDQELTGNRGIIMGHASSESAVERKKTRRIYNLEIELPYNEQQKSSRKTTTSKKYTEKKDVSQSKVVSRSSAEKEQGSKTSSFSKAPQVVYSAPSSAGLKYQGQSGAGILVKGVQGKPAKVTTYVVKKGDTLQKISSEMYGTAKKWKKIYDANKDVLKSPDTIKPGQKLVIPE